MIDVEVDSLLSHARVIAHGRERIVRRLREREHVLGFDLPDGDFQVMREHERHPVVVHQSELRVRECVCAQQGEQLSWYQTALTVKEVDLDSCAQSSTVIGSRSIVYYAHFT